MSGIYIHIPFCRQACTYCDFHFSTGLAGKPAMVEAIVSEIRSRSTYLTDRLIGSVYFGGGTPSLLSAGELNAILEEVHRHFIFAADAEITLEANPDDISESGLKQWLALGINRLSIGLQSFNDAELKWMNRAHTAAESLSSVKMAQDAGFGNLSIDLIYGSRFQDLKSWEQTLERALGLGTTHISSYNLTIEKRTALGSWYARGKEPGVSDSLSTQQFKLMSDVLQSAGFLHYEISNFALPGFLARHNSNYWLRKHYLGVGPSAHSYNGASRQWNVRSNAAYVKAIKSGASFFETESLGSNERYNEYLLTRLRTIWGCDIVEIKQLFGGEVAGNFLTMAERYKNELVEKNGIYTLNMEGRLRADAITSDFFLV